VFAFAEYKCETSAPEVEVIGDYARYNTSALGGAKKLPQNFLKKCLTGRKACGIIKTSGEGSDGKPYQKKGNNTNVY
jgi:hypothetical protein